MSQSRSRRRRGLALLTASATALTGSALLLGPGTGAASSHREAPGTLRDPLTDHTDVYAFVSPDDPDTTTLIANVLPFQDPTGGPNFYPFEDGDSARYEINVDNDGDAKRDVTFRWTFKTNDKRGNDTFLFNNGPVTSLDDENLLFKQSYTLERIDAGGDATTLVEDAPVAPSHVGDASMPDYADLRREAVSKLEGGGRSFAGQADDPFFADLRVFDLLYGGDLSETGVDSLDGKNVNTMAVKVPTADLTRKGDPVIGVWSTASRRSMNVINADGTREASGDFVQVSRLGNPLVNEVVIPTGLKDAFNSLTPDKDATVQAAVDRVNDPEVPKLIEKIYGIPAPEAPRDDLFSIFLTGIEGLNKPEGKVQPAELLRLNTSIDPVSKPNRLGVLAKDTAGFPNGRRLTDDVVDIELQALEGAVRENAIIEELATGDRVNINDKEFSRSFPYIALPHSGSVGTESRQGGSNPSGGVAAGAGGTASTQAAPTPAGAPGSGRSPALPAAVAGLGVLLAAGGVLTLRRRGSAA